MNELREANNEEGVGESENDRDDALEPEQGFTNALLELQSEAGGTTIVGEESGRLPPRTPVDWKPPPVKTHIGAPEFKTDDNPGQWSEYTFHLVFAKGGGIYKRHALPTVTMQLPQDSSGTIQINWWEFHYTDWYGGVGTHINPVGAAEQFPPERKGCHDKDVLRNLGITKHRMVVQYYLFFYQILLPICDVNNSGIVDDPRHNYFSYVEISPLATHLTLDSQAPTAITLKSQQLTSWSSLMVLSSVTG